MMLLLHRRELISRVMEALSPGTACCWRASTFWVIPTGNWPGGSICRETAIRMRLSRARHRAMNLILTLEGSEI